VKDLPRDLPSAGPGPHPRGQIAIAGSSQAETGDSLSGGSGWAATGLGGTIRVQNVLAELAWDGQ
jgi:hypothetical protein